MVDALRRPLHANIVFFCMAIVALNLLDAFATLRHLEHGASEVTRSCRRSCGTARCASWW